MPKKEHAPPVKEFRFGRVKAVIWAKRNRAGNDAQRHVSKALPRR